MDAADGFTKLGLSEGDMLELEARIIDIGTALGIADEELGTAGTGRRGDSGGAGTDHRQRCRYWIEQIGKAAGGSEKALRDARYLPGSSRGRRCMRWPIRQDHGGRADGRRARSGPAARHPGGARAAYQGGIDGEPGTSSRRRRSCKRQDGERYRRRSARSSSRSLTDCSDFILRGIEGWELFAEMRMGRERAGDRATCSGRCSGRSGSCTA